MIVRVAQADIAMHMAFPRSVSRWQRNNDDAAPLKTYDGDCDAILFGENDAVVIDGDCSGGVSAPEGGMLHIYGDLSSSIDVDGHYEIIIAGDVRPGGLIQASGFCHVFVGGEFSGRIRATGSSRVWIGADLRGAIQTGTPSTDIYVGGDYHGAVSPTGKAALLTMTVGGFASDASLATIADHGYTVFRAAVARSDVKPGLYPLTGYHRKTARGNSYNRWCVECERT